MRDIINDIARRGPFYFRDQYRRLVIGCMVLLTLNTALGGYVFYKIYTEKPSEVYVTTSLGDLIHLVPTTDRTKATVGLPAVINDDF